MHLFIYSICVLLYVCMLFYLCICIHFEYMYILLLLQKYFRNITKRNIHKHVHKLVKDKGKIRNYTVKLNL